MQKPFLHAIAARGRVLLSIPLLLSPLAAARAASPDPIWIEAERMPMTGGWTVDSQFVDQMGSPYLLAAGLANPVEDAVATVTPASPGPHRLWIRSRDWRPASHPGRFQVLIDGRPAGPAFGASGRQGWTWEDGGIHDLPARAEIRLRDLTGEYGRCDAIALCPDTAWIPPDAPASLASLRQRLGAVGATIVDAPEHDVVVVGGGLAGCIAAVSAARLGARTALIQNRPLLGGNASTEILVPPVGVWPHDSRDPLDPRETGVVEEIRTAGDQGAEEAIPYAARLRRLVGAEPDIDLHLDTHATGVERIAPDRIGAVIATRLTTGQRLRFRARIFVDCTGDGAIGIAAGADHRRGREARSEHDEPSAPERPSPTTMGNSIKYLTEQTPDPQPFTAPAWAERFPDCASLTGGRHPRLGGSIGWQWMIELGGDRDTVGQAEEIRDDLIALAFGLWDHVKNHCAELSPKAVNHRLAWVGHVAGRRESARLLGDVIIDERDIADATPFPDRVAYGAWGIDDHHSGGFHDPRGASVHTYKSVPFSVPFRALYSRNVRNLLMAGRNISATHLALCATRVMLTCAVIGQAAGTGAALCVRLDKEPRALHRDSIATIQQTLLKDGAHILDLPNRDPDDLARAAAVAASDTGPGPDGNPSRPAAVIDGFARASRAGAGVWCPDPSRPAPHAIELTWTEPRTFNCVHLSFLTAEHRAATFEIRAGADPGHPAAARVGNNRHRRVVVPIGRVTADRLRILFPDPADAARLALAELRVYDESPRALEIALRARRNRDLPDPDPAFPWAHLVSAPPPTTGIDPATLEGIILDDRQATRVGRWILSDHTRPYIGAGYLHDGDSDKGRKSLAFHPRVPGAGTYEILLGYSPGPNRASRVPVTVRVGGETRAITVDQRKPAPAPPVFAPIGRFDLAPDRPLEIRVENRDTTGYVSVDAIQILPR